MAVGILVFFSGAFQLKKVKEKNDYCDKWTFLLVLKAVIWQVLC